MKTCLGMSFPCYVFWFGLCFCQLSVFILCLCSVLQTWFAAHSLVPNAQVRLPPFRDAPLDHYGYRQWREPSFKSSQWCPDFYPGCNQRNALKYSHQIQSLNSSNYRVGICSNSCKSFKKSMKNVYNCTPIKSVFLLWNWLWVITCWLYIPQASNQPLT